MTIPAGIFHYEYYPSTLFQPVMMAGIWPQAELSKEHTSQTVLPKFPVTVEWSQGGQVLGRRIF